MIDFNNNNIKIENIKKETTKKIKGKTLENDNAKKSYNEQKFNINNNNSNKKPNDDPVNLKIKSAISSKDIEKKPKCIQIDSTLTKVKTFNKRRIDRFGNMIMHGGKQKVSFIDRVSKNNFTEVVNIENYKEYNKMEEPTNNHGNGCCILL